MLVHKHGLHIQNQRAFLKQLHEKELGHKPLWAEQRNGPTQVSCCQDSQCKTRIICACGVGHLTATSEHAVATPGASAGSQHPPPGQSAPSVKGDIYAPYHNRDPKRPTYRRRSAKLSCEETPDVRRDTGHAKRHRSCEETPADGASKLEAHTEISCTSRYDCGACCTARARARGSLQRRLHAQHWIAGWDMVRLTGGWINYLAVRLPRFSLLLGCEHVVRL